jgi:pyroglutamyl-peptidase
MPTMTQPRILLTGFDPFGGDTLNPSWQVAQALHGEHLGGAVVQALCLPCVFGAALDALRAALRLHRPVLVLALGVAPGRADLTLERVAINVDDARIPCNAGLQPIDEPVVPGGPVAYFSGLPIKAMVAALLDAGLPASVSQTAGTFVCNHVFYGLMHTLRRRPRTRGGFMHLPLLPEQAAAHANAPSLALHEQVRGVRLALATALATARDVRAGGGAVA